MAERRHEEGELVSVGIPEPTSACVLPDTPDDGRSPQGWISVEGLKVLGALVRQLQSRMAEPGSGGPDGGDKTVRESLSGRRQRPAGADLGATAASGEGARTVTRRAGEER